MSATIETYSPPTSKRRRSETFFNDSQPISPRLMADALLLNRSCKRSRHADATNSHVDEASASSSTPVPPACDPSSSKAAGKRKHSKVSKRGINHSKLTKLEVRKEREAAWKRWCEEHRWESKDDPGYKQKVGSKEVHRSDAMSYFRLKDYEIDTLPYVTFDNAHNPMIPGKSYSLGNLYTLVARKFAFIAGLDPGVNMKTQEEFLRRGWQLFEAETKKRDSRMKDKGKTPKALVFGVMYIPCQPRRDPHERRVKPRPFGSWTSRVYEDGVYIGEWLNFQFDPHDDDYQHRYERYERFRPKDAEWDWALDDGLC